MSTLSPLPAHWKHAKTNHVNLIRKQRKPTRAKTSVRGKYWRAGEVRAREQEIEREGLGVYLRISWLLINGVSLSSAPKYLYFRFRKVVCLFFLGRIFRTFIWRRSNLCLTILFEFISCVRTGLSIWPPILTTSQELSSVPSCHWQSRKFLDFTLLMFILVLVMRPVKMAKGISEDEVYVVSSNRFCYFSQFSSEIVSTFVEVFNFFVTVEFSKYKYSKPRLKPIEIESRPCWNAENLPFTNSHWPLVCLTSTVLVSYHSSQIGEQCITI